VTLADDDDLSAAERARLAALDSYSILDTPLEDIFNELASLAASTVGTPTALVSFVDGTRQWFKARCGLDVNETPRDVAFCAHAIQGKEVFVVPDATADERFAQNPLVTGKPGIRFYAGAPLITLEGHALGTLCVIDYVPRKLSCEEKEALLALSQHVMAQLEMRRRLIQFTRGNSLRQKRVNNLRRALEENEFGLFYQPTVNVCTGRVEGLEALIRWNCPRRGLIAPADFIPCMEDSGLIVEVGEWILKRAAADYRAWRTRGFTVPPIAVNVSPLQLQHPGFVQQLSRATEASGDDRVRLNIEITEGVLMDNTEAVIRRLTEIRRLGVKIALDDFGTGYSSLRYLARLPIDILKIDRAFVATMTERPEDTWMVSSVISLAHGLKLTVIAEGVENQEQQKLLRLLRCDQMQGYHFSPPVPAHEVEAFLQRDQQVEELTANASLAGRR